MMFGKKSDDAESAEAAETGAQPVPAQRAMAPRAAAGAAPIIPPRRPVIRPEVVRRSGDYLSGSSANERPVGGYGDGKKLIVGRDIALSGSINACEKLIVEGRVEANITDCQEIEITDTGTFKGEAEIDVAEISGAFEGKLLARELLLVRNTGRVNGDIRYGRLEVERGGQIDGEVRVFSEDGEGGGS